LHEYGAFTVFASVLLEKIGGPTPAETLLVIAALLATSQSFWVWHVILAGWLGGAVGGIIAYAIGLVFFAQFFPFLRQVKGVAAGAANMSWPAYLVANLSGTGLWALVWAGGAYLLGQRVTGLQAFVNEYALAILAVPFILALAAAAGIYWRSRRSAGAL